MTDKILQMESPSSSVHRGYVIPRFLVTCLVFLFLTGYTSNKNTNNSVDRKDPESVLRAYFEAWNRNDESTRASMMADMYAHMTPEPVESIRILELQPLPDSSESERNYRVVFEIKVKGSGVSMNSGQYDWTYTLSWDATRGSWLITNYGAG